MNKKDKDKSADKEFSIVAAVVVHIVHISNINLNTIVHSRI